MNRLVSVLVYRRHVRIRVLDRETEREEIVVCVRKLKNNKTGGSDGLVGELLKYGGSGMIDLFQQLFAVV